MTHSLKEVIDTLRQIAVEMPNEQTQCFYSKEGETADIEMTYRGIPCPTAETPKCVIGHLVHRLDGVEGLRQLIENFGVEDQPDVFRELGYTDEALTYMGKAQMLHDEGYTFSEAVGEATEGA